MKVQFRVLDHEIPYTGKELRPHWGLEQTEVYGPLIVGFTGPCTVPTEHLVDYEDRLNNDSIKASSMLHFIGEFFDLPLHTGVFYQRLFMVWAEKLLREEGLDVKRSGDDLFVGSQKLSVSIATVSNVSVLIHWALNIDPTGAPVDATGLNKLGWQKSDVLAFAKKLLSHYIGELEEIEIAKTKVRPV